MLRARAVYVSLFLGLAMALLWPGSSSAQQTTATISGVVTDESQALLPGVTVLVRNVQTGIQREVLTNEEGRYSVPSLGLGNYEVEATLEGFQTSIRQGITLTVGREALVNFALKVGQITEKVTVMGEAPLVETTQAAVRDLVDDRQIRDLPLNGRSFTDLAFLQAGVWSRTRQGGYSSTGGGGSQLSIAGSRAMMTSFLLDGTNVKDMLGVSPGSAAGTMLGVDAVREFSVMATNYTAEFGGAGGVIHTVTKSGTNELNGTAFWFHRNDNMDAANFFDAPILDSSRRFVGKAQPEFKRNQFGASIGGPIIRDRTFFFGTVEGLRDRLGNTSISRVPSAESRSGDLLSRRVTVHPAIKPYLDLYPLPNIGVLRASDDTGEYVSSQTIPTDENYFLIRVDHKLSDRDSFYVRYNFDDADKVTPKAVGPFALAARTRTQYVTIEESKIVSPTLFNTFRFGFNRSRGATPNLDPGLPRTLNFFQPESLYPDRFFGTLVVSGVATIGQSDTQDRAQVMNLFQWTDTMRYNRGAHSFSFGGDIQRSQVNAQIGSRLHGSFRFTSLPNFLTNSPQRFEGLFPGTGTYRGFRQVQVGLFVQDDWKATKKLTVNLGLRWEFVTIPTEVAGRVANIPNPLDPAPTIGDPIFELSKKNFAPRIGFAYDPTGQGKMAIRTSFGLFHQQQDYVNNFTLYFQNPPFFNRFVMEGAPFPTPFQSLSEIPSSAASGVPAQFHATTPYTMQYNLSVQRQVWTNTQLTVSYVGTRGVKIPRLMQGNINRFIVQPDGRKFFPVGTTRANPNFANLDYKQSDTNTHYNSLQVRLNKRFSQGHQYQVSYTFSKAIDQCASGLQGGSSGGGGVGCMDPFDKSRDKGLSGWDVRHNVTSNFGVSLPGAGLAGWAGAALGHWSLNSIITVATGSPFTVTISETANRARSRSEVIGGSTNYRPDLKPGGNSNPIVGDGRDPNRYLDPSQFVLQEAGYFGNLGRTTVTGPGYANIDLSLVRDIPMGESSRLQFRGELFNLLNRANFSGPNTVVFATNTGSPAAAFGTIRSTDGTARQIQLGLKIFF
ncbi:MAG: TonB-dependent receptor [Acidobacteria bacterium]|nr:TonB-dependent receptor [Acidobacteriota bacterium]